jgi:hypothetical protein
LSHQIEGEYKEKRKGREGFRHTALAKRKVHLKASMAEGKNSQYG